MWRRLWGVHITVDDKIYHRHMIGNAGKQVPNLFCVAHRIDQTQCGFPAVRSPVCGNITVGQMSLGRLWTVWVCQCQMSNNMCDKAK